MFLQTVLVKDTLEGICTGASICISEWHNLGKKRSELERALNVHVMYVFAMTIYF